MKIKKVYKKIGWVLLFVFTIWYINCLPEPLFNKPKSTVLLDGDGNLLAAAIAADGQWRMQETDSIPAKFETCILQFEDRNFYHHIGISASGIGRALVQNIKQKKIVSGGSTISMQLARIMRGNPKRTFSEKLLEMLLATRIEIAFSKKEILNYYANNAPFGNNVVGIEAASWRYYCRSAHLLSWAESATLAVLPNAPGLIYPGKNHQRLLLKRNRLLKRLFVANFIDGTTYELSLQEPLPEKPLALPQLSQHLLARFMKTGFKGKTITSAINGHLQQRIVALAAQYSLQMQENKINNLAVMVTSVQSGKVLCYIGNALAQENEHANKVDCIQAPRSTGSILKPVLYESALEDGLINPATLLLDIPSSYGSFSPKNFSKEYNGAVAANTALARSLNIPFVRLLNDYGLEKFHADLKNMGINSLHKPAKHYGLSLILGGAEARLWDLNLLYTCMAQTLLNGSIKGIGLLKDSNELQIKAKKSNYNRACIYATFEAMVEVNRPDEDGNWRVFAGAQKIAWKTGTSFGFRDGWAIGITPDYVVSVWVGNAAGEGRPGLTGIKAAAPLLFSVFAQLPKSNAWFKKPLAEMVDVKLCSKSGYRAGDLCENTIVSSLPKTCLQTTNCPYHQLIHLNKKTGKRVDSDCESPAQMLHVSWFVLPPMVAKYYGSNHTDYKPLPEYKAECISKISDRALSIVYPKPNSKIYVPLEIDGNKGRSIFEATHRNHSTKIYWHLDEVYLGETRDIHQLSLNPAHGKHTLSLIDENGVSASVKFEVLK